MAKPTRDKIGLVLFVASIFLIVLALIFTNEATRLILAIAGFFGLISGIALQEKYCHCPSCGVEIPLSGKSIIMYCPYCGTEIDKEQLYL